MSDQDQKAQISELIVRERLARDAGRWDEMTAAWARDAWIEVSWFKGNSADFVAQTKAQVNPDNLVFHQLSPGAVTINGDRATVDMPCVMQCFAKLNGIAVNQSAHAHLLWRATRHDGGWLLSGLRCYYVRDLMVVCDPSSTITLDETRLATYREAYRYLCYILEAFGGTSHDDLPGSDRPDTVTALYAGERAWLDG